jgi:hypothetical protein
LSIVNGSIKQFLVDKHVKHGKALCFVPSLHKHKYNSSLLSFSKVKVPNDGDMENDKLSIFSTHLAVEFDQVEHSFLHPSEILE